jgi:hypothetical protein
MKTRLILSALALTLVGLTATVDAGPTPSSGACVPQARCRTDADCGVNPATGQYLGLCAPSPYKICLCY